MRPPLTGFPAAVLAAVIALAPALIVGPAALTAPAAAQSEPSPSAVYDPGPLTDGSPAPEPSAEAWIVADLDTGEVFASHQPGLQHAPASTIKLLSGLALVDELDDPEHMHEATYEDMLVDGTKVGLVQKNDYSIDDLFHAMLMSSANDAAHALADAAGGQDEAVDLMNAKAEDLRLTGTEAWNTSGLDEDDQVTTAEDLLRIGRAVLDDEYLMDIIATTDYDFPGATNPDTGEELSGYPIQNHTRIVGEVDGGLGLKNGYTRAAGGSFVAVVERDDRRLAAAVLGGETMTRDAAVDLIEWSFAQSSPQPIGTMSFETAAEAAETAAAQSPTASVPTDDAAVAADAADSVDAEGGPPGLPHILLAGGIGLGAATAVALWLRVRRDRRQRD
ncbi:D-alanyl-D-alanine carboxypeptidase family protein [Brevibacterium jeotgali]|uniref:D-alanyl-D-alanine carboxypeptidase (Penicillin-binding protein 5/6) n=1 Tax=Brevibacterium jeotgali TaxID=1262550 RepID=A0A2H1L123_9MICO|nr:serine hydrolase [Brevibacterium jeotgali]TWC02216.1 D-alanyl-D-alanine carboxypeptidase [Brevibacterium jeotgali]SMY10435.1 D-alanyl-D-alanine carboxypeptidase (penicillin-binding protein 5/6) [Brevibacterium jeotgali]